LRFPRLLDRGALQLAGADVTPAWNQAIIEVFSGLLEAMKKTEGRAIADLPV
jgi:hypothetical protein